MSLVAYKNRMMSPGIFNFLNDVIGDDYTTSRSFKSNVPAVNVIENDNSFELELAVPGIDKKDISINVENDVLTISSEQKNEHSEEDKNFTRREFHYASFERSFTLPEDVDGENIKAKQENGLLNISIPKKEDKASVRKMIKIS